jgi:hypothetical protein
MSVSKQLGELSKIYLTLAETKNLAMLKMEGKSYTIDDLQILYDKGFRVINVDTSSYCTRLLCEKPV